LSYKDNLLRYAIRILESYTGEMPLQGWLKNFFRENPQMGSRDRKQVTEMAYCFFRLGHTLKNTSKKERIIIGLFLSNNKREEILEYLNPDWHHQIEKTTEEKINIVQAVFSDFDLLEIFPWKNLLSADVDHRAFCLSFLEKPRLFIRIRPGMENAVTNKLKNNQIHFHDADPEAVLPFKSYSFISATKLDGIFKLNFEAVIQDLSSQLTSKYLKNRSNKSFDAWDCCAGSGGKSILFTDLNPKCRLTVSDIRESILNNLKKRFTEAGVDQPVFYKADLTDQNDLPKLMFPFIIADLPCTGSGTWSRTPEALYFFDPQTVVTFQQRQEKILSHVISRLKPEGVLVYITCSVFAGENEFVTSHLIKSGRLNMESAELIKGYGKYADSMYAARFLKITGSGN
jgi:16S rRNA (cytosine967-C5)-methyltransferase